MEKTAEDDGEVPDFGNYEQLEGKIAGHTGFRDRVSIPHRSGSRSVPNDIQYFNGFVPREEKVDASQS
jgi:hypothetical protein